MKKFDIEKPEQRKKKEKDKDELNNEIEKFLGK